MSAILSACYFPFQIYLSVGEQEVALGKYGFISTFPMLYLAVSLSIKMIFLMNMNNITVHMYVDRHSTTLLTAANITMELKPECK